MDLSDYNPSFGSSVVVLELPVIVASPDATELEDEPTEPAESLQAAEEVGEHHEGGSTQAFNAHNDVNPVTPGVDPMLTQNGAQATNVFTQQFPPQVPSPLKRSLYGILPADED